MSISLKTHKLIWGRSGNMCAFPDCKKQLVIDETSTDDPSVIGQEAHIVAKKENGPRGQHPLELEKRDKYDNLILLCSVHHKLIDDQENEYTVEKLHDFKNKHETWVKENLTLDKQKIRDDELYATYIQKFIELTNLENWTNWISYMLGMWETFPKEEFDTLKKVPNYIVSRIWPQRYLPLESSLINFKNILNDLVRLYHEFPDENPNGYSIEKFYKNYQREKFYHNQEAYCQEAEIMALEHYEYHVALIIDLVIELTRALNYVCDQIRYFLFEGFRIEEGVILISRTDFFSSQSFRVEYRGGERIEMPYKGLKDFMTSRSGRDYFVGSGINEYYFKKNAWE
ncbi:hypothetical protein Q4517_01960 [Tenacibaculum sp. 1_MG-2023]|uniref:HNH endonuclease n=1 Tax=Tenacibaculum sp. 1_MG-2023 TaxID=3062653 RepID=UPI0026E2F093|nr:HNH endonuclease [Tenacibaculum sp. 1_MG-2023]MDO6674313.1 hypothetical protein [Tenacibaculum sp. 1_MG-2023]